jgi:hypothetical protein
VDTRSGLEQTNKKMNDEVYKLRRKAMEYIYRAKNIVRDQLGARMPRVTIRVTELTNKDSRMLASARMGENIIWVTEDAILEPEILQEVVYHELVHAVFNVGHKGSCPLMSPNVNSTPLSPGKADELFLKYAKKHFKRRAA